MKILITMEELTNIIRKEYKLSDKYGVKIEYRYNDKGELEEIVVQQKEDTPEILENINNN